VRIKLLGELAKNLKMTVDKTIVRKADCFILFCLYTRKQKDYPDSLALASIGNCSRNCLSVYRCFLVWHPSSSALRMKIYPAQFAQVIY